MHCTFFISYDFFPTEFSWQGFNKAESHPRQVHVNIYSCFLSLGFVPPGFTDEVFNEAYS